MIVTAKGKTKKDHGRHERETEQDKGQVMQTSMPGSGCRTEGWVRGESKTGEGDAC